MADDMADGATTRLGLPLLQAGQAQKEITHNEALARLDYLAQPVVQTVGTVTPPAAPAPGSAWIVGKGATGAWAGQDDAIAAATPGGWRFTASIEGLAAWSIADAGIARYVGGSWLVGARGAAIAAPSGGSVVDGEARAAIGAILSAMRGQGLVAS